MNYLFLKVYNLVIVILLAVNIHQGTIYAQNSSIEHALEIIRGTYGSNQVLFNGVYFEDIYRYDIGTPFYYEEFREGYIILHDQKFEDVLLKYNINEQNIVVQQPGNDNTALAFLPPLDFISEFAIQKEVFKKYTFDEHGTAFYNEVFKGTLIFLQSWEKKKVKSTHNANFIANKYSQAKRKNIVVLNGQAYVFTSNKSFLKLFPEAIRKELAALLKSESINLKVTPVNQLRDFFMLCDNTYSSYIKNNSSKN